MKKLFLIFLVSLCAFQASAQYYGHSGYGNRFNRGSSGEYLSTGYRGMVEIANGACFDADFSTLFSTTHGYQFNPYFYLGGFVSFGTIECYDCDDYYDYYLGFNFRWGVDARTYLSKGRFAPFLGLQFGMDTYDDDPFVYFSGQVGFRVALKNKLALNFAVQIGPEDYFDYGEAIFKLGFEF